MENKQIFLLFVTLTFSFKTIFSSLAPFKKAAARGDLKTIKKMVKDGFDIDMAHVPQYYYCSSEIKSTPIELATLGRISWVSKDKQPKLFETAKYFVEQGIDPTCALYGSADIWDLPTIKYLMKNGARSDQLKPNWSNPQTDKLFSIIKKKIRSRGILNPTVKSIIKEKINLKDIQKFKIDKKIDIYKNFFENTKKHNVIDYFLKNGIDPRTIIEINNRLNNRYQLYFYKRYKKLFLQSQLSQYANKLQLNIPKFGEQVENFVTNKIVANQNFLVLLQNDDLPTRTKIEALDILAKHNLLPIKNRTLFNSFFKQIQFSPVFFDHKHIRHLIKDNQLENTKDYHGTTFQAAYREKKKEKRLS